LRVDAFDHCSAARRENRRKYLDLAGLNRPISDASGTKISPPLGYPTENSHLWAAAPDRHGCRFGGSLKARGGAGALIHVNVGQSRGGNEVADRARRALARAGLKPSSPYLAWYWPGKP